MESLQNLTKAELLEYILELKQKLTEKTKKQRSGTRSRQSSTQRRFKRPLAIGKSD